MRARLLLAAVVAVAVAAAPGFAAAKADPRIVGGHAAPAGAYPWMVTLTVEGSLVCGGTLIAADTVLTAAHCAVGMTPDEMQVTVGRERMSDEASGQVVDVAGYAEYPGHADAAILRLAEPVEGIAPIGLATPEQAALYAPGETATAVGWGLREENSFKPSDRLRDVDVPIVSDESCLGAYGEILSPGSEICAGRAGRDTCSGDSGGPLFFRDEAGVPYQVGITSFGRGCGRARYPGVYAEIPEILEFLQDPDPVFAPVPARDRARIDGEASVGERLRCDEGPWAGEGIEFKYEWHTGFSPAPRGRKRGFTLSPKLAGKKVSCSVTGTTDGGSIEISSPPVRVHGDGR